MERQPGRQRPEDPIQALQKDILVDLMFAIPIIRQQQTVPPELLATGRKRMEGIRQTCEAHALPLGRLMAAAISLLDAPIEAA